MSPFFSYWGIIRDLLEQAEKGGKGARLFALTEDFLENSQSPSHKSKTKPPTHSIYIRRFSRRRLFDTQRME